MNDHRTGIYPDLRAQLVDLAEDLAAHAALHAGLLAVSGPLGAASAALGNACQAVASDDNGRVATAKALCEILMVALHPDATPAAKAATTRAARFAAVGAARAGRALCAGDDAGALRSLRFAREHLVEIARTPDRVPADTPVRLGADQPAVVTRAVPA